MPQRILSGTMEGAVLRSAAVLLGGGVALAACAMGPAPGVARSSAYLQRAQEAVAARDGPAALVALDGAESAWLTTPMAHVNPCVYHDKPELRAIGGARQSVQQARWQDAGRYIGVARAEVGASG